MLPETGDAPRFTLCPLQIVALLPAVAEGNGLTVTFAVAAAEGPLHPFAVTEIVAVPKYPEAHVTVEVIPVPEMVLPVPLTLQL